MAELTEQEKSILGLIQQQISPEQFEKFMQLPVEQIKAQIAQILSAQKSPQGEQECLFCNIVAGKVPAKKVFEDENTIAFLDINPINLGHTLVCPKKHHTVLPQMPDEEVSILFKHVKRLTSAVFDGTGAEGVQIKQNNGPAAGQVVPHVHIHIIPRFSNDGFDPKYQTKKVTDDQLEQTSKKIIASIPQERKPISPETPRKLINMQPKIP